MLHIGQFLNFLFVPAASNDNDDLLALTFPAIDLALIRAIKNSMREDNAASGVLLASRKDRKFFQEVVDAEHYIQLRYFSVSPPEDTLRALKRRILDKYLSPKKRKAKAKKPN